MASSLPMTLRLYRRLSAAAVPLAPALINRRLKQGKEDPARVGERRGMSEDVRPHGPLVWIHGASVGEVLAAAALIERLRALNLRILLTSGTVTSAAIVAKRFPADIIHQYVPYDSPRYVARFLDHWRPSLALFIESDLWPNLILSSAARRLPMVLINGRMSHRSFPRWRKITSTISALLGRFDVCLAQSQRRRRALRRTRQPQCHHHRKPQARCSGAARRCGQAGAADVGDARPADYRRGLDASRRGRNPDRRAQDAGRIFSAVADRDRAAASRSRRGHRPHSSPNPACMSACVRTRNCRPRRTISMSPTPWANSACSTGWRRSCSWEGRWFPMAGKIRSRRSSSAPRSFMVRMFSISPMSMRRSTRPAAPGKRIIRKRWSSSSASCWPIPWRAKPRLAASTRVVEQLGGALERTMTALEPYLLQLRLEMGAASA